MAKSKKPKVNATTRKRDTGEVKLIGAEVDPSLDRALEACAKKELRTKKGVIILALQQYLEAAGLWPPADAKES